MENVIYINTKDSPSGLELYTTLAHEGYPGHLYQSVYHQLYHSKSNEDNIRHLLWYGGYLEGWALYVEFLSFDYACEIMEKENYPDSAYAYQLEKHNRSLQLCLYSLLDIAIHYDGATYEEITSILHGLGITSCDSIQSIYEYIAFEPTNYLKYYLGYLEILELQNMGKTLWKEDYSDYLFHKFYLECGPSDFTNLQKQLTLTAAPEKND